MEEILNEGWQPNWPGNYRIRRKPITDGFYPEVDFGLSFEDYVRLNGKDGGRHWSSKVNTDCGVCYSRYPSKKMMKKADRICFTPFPAYLVRLAYRKYRGKMWHKEPTGIAGLAFELWFQI
jgi:hypothetical protein